MNGELEDKLAGNNVFQFKNGYLIADVVENECIQRELQMEVLRALDRYLAEHRDELPIVNK